MKMTAIISFNVETKKTSSTSLYSKIFSKVYSESEHSIDWDISLAILNPEDKLVSQECFVFYNNHNYNDGTISLRGDSIVFAQAPEFDEEVIIDFSKLPIETSSIVFYLSNQQKFNFQITNIEVQIENSSNTSDNQFRIYNTSICNAIELFRLKRNNENEIWKVEILNNPISDPNGLEYILKKII